MCGASSEQYQLQDEQIQFYQQAQQESAATFSEQQGIIKQLEGIYSPILAKGPNQMGYSDQELDTLNAQAVEGTAENYSRAAKAVNEQIAAQGGGNLPGVTTGGQEQLKAEIAASSAAEQSREETGIMQAGYEQGYNEFKQATDALATASGQLSPATYENAATSAGSSASQTANEIAQENNSWINAAIGAAGSIGSAVIDQNPGGIFGK